MEPSKDESNYEAQHNPCQWHNRSIFTNRYTQLYNEANWTENCQVVKSSFNLGPKSGYNYLSALQKGEYTRTGYI